MNRPVLIIFFLFLFCKISLAFSAFSRDSIITENGDSLLSKNVHFPVPADTITKRIATARRLMKEFRIDNAIDTLENIYQKDSSSVELMRELEEIYYSSSATIKALKLADRLLKTGQDSSIYLAHKALLLKKEGKLTESMALLNDLVAKDSSNTFFLNKIAEIYTSYHMSDSAMIYYTKSVEISPKSLTIYKACQLLIDKEQLEDALTFFNNYYDPEFHTSKPLRRLYGQTFYLLNNIEKSVEVFKELYQKGDSSFITTKFLGMSYRKKGDYLEAEQPLRQAARQNPNDFLVYFNLGICCRNIGLIDESEKHFNTAINIITAPILTKNMINTELAQTYEKQMKWEKALKLYQAILKSDPSNLSVRMNALFILDYQLKDTDRAIEGYRKALVSIAKDTSKTNNNQRLEKYLNQRIEKLQKEKFWKEKPKI
jgi:tetratricopeptide (TPR) repeat protein